MVYPFEHFEKYWRKRLYKHPEENKNKIKEKARIFYNAGFYNGSFEQRKEYLKIKKKFLGGKDE